MTMRWRDSYLDLILVPLSIIISILYHCWLWFKIRSQPHQTIIGINSAYRRLWVLAMIKDNEKKNILTVQSIRNVIMGSTLMATTSVLLCTGLAAVISSTYSVKETINDSIYGARGEYMTALKYVCMLFIFLFAFICYSLSIRFMNSVNFLINIVPTDNSGTETGFHVGPEYVCNLMEKGFVLNMVGNRLFYAGLPMLMWIFGPVGVFLSSVVVVLIQYTTDVIFDDGKSHRARCWKI